MIDPGSLDSISRNPLQQKTATQTTRETERERETLESDRFEPSSNRTRESRPEQEPITDREVAREAVAQSVAGIFASPGDAFAAQADLDPETVLSLVG